MPTNDYCTSTHREHSIVISTFEYISENIKWSVVKYVINMNRRLV